MDSPRTTADKKEEHIPVELQTTSSPIRYQLSFGVEFEFYLAYRADHPNPDPEDPRQIYGIVDEDSTYKENRKQAHAHMTRTMDNVGLPAWSKYAADTHSSPHKWEVKKDTTVGDFDLQGYKFLGVEVTTPPLRYSKQSRNLIRAFPDLFTRKYRLSCTDRTALHVHVGNGYQGFEPVVLCNLFSVLWVFCDRLDALHPHSCQHIHAQPGGYWCPSLRKYSKLSDQVSKVQVERSRVLIH